MQLAILVPCFLVAAGLCAMPHLVSYDLGNAVYLVYIAAFNAVGLGFLGNSP